MAKKDYYQVLGVDKKAGADQIKKAYRRMARKHHPDVNPGNKNAEERFKEIQEAYDALKDPEKRAQYDRFGHTRPVYDFSQQSPGRGGGIHGEGAEDFSQGFGARNFEDLFGDIFGGGYRSGAAAPGPVRGRDVESEFTITLDQAFTGTETRVTLPLEKECPSCGGQGETLGKNTRTCPTCKGSGRSKVGKGPLNFSTACPTCRGRGKTGFERCKVCGGQGLISETRRLTVKIPAGISDGSRIRAAGGGESTGTSPSGDLYIKIHVQPHPVFKREGDDLHSEEPLSFDTAILGGKIDVRTIDGPTSAMTVPPGTQAGQKFRLKGKGMPKVKGDGRGDLYVRTVITVPRSVDPESRKLIEDFAGKNRSSE